MADNNSRQARDGLADVRSTSTETGRVNQKLRTRQALIAAATELLDAGVTPTLADVAERAGISKTTAYRYFASADVLIAEVYFDRDFPEVGAVLGTASDEPTERVLAVERAVNDTLLAHELATRMILRNALDVGLAGTDDPPPRVGRRQALISAALQPLESELDPKLLERLRDALALVIGPEAIVAARDVCGLTPDETREVTRWAAEGLVGHAIAQANTASGHRQNRRKDGSSGRAR
jgi:AcrR family transcriptional regulator